MSDTVVVRCDVCGKVEARGHDALGLHCCSTPGCLALPETESADAGGGWPEFSAWEDWMEARFDRPCTGCANDFRCLHCLLREWWDGTNGLLIRSELYDAIQDWLELQKTELVQTYTTEANHDR